MSQHTFEFERNGIFYESSQSPILCATSMRKIFGVKDGTKKVRILGSLARPHGKGWISVKPDPKREIITVKGKHYEMHYDLEMFLAYLGVQNERFYVKLEK